MSSTIDRPATKRPQCARVWAGPGAAQDRGAGESRAPGGPGQGRQGGRATLESHAQFESGAARDPAGLLLGQAQSRVPELSPDPAWAGPWCPRCTLLSGCCATDGRGPGHHADVGAVGAAVRRRAPVQFRRVRLAGAAVWSSMPTTSTRPCPARPSGTSKRMATSFRGLPDGTAGSRPRAKALWVPETFARSR